MHDVTSLADVPATLRVLLAEDDRIIRITLRNALQKAGYHVTECPDGASALRAAELEPFDVALSDVRLPQVDGITLFRRLRQAQPGISVLLMTAYANASDAVEVMRAGARDYITKPFELDELLLRIERVRRELDFRKQMESGSATPRPTTSFGAASAAGRWLCERIDSAGMSDSSVLLTGETGTGKDRCARAIHERSRRADKAFVAVNCAAIPDTLFESELFGHERGAFTGADRRKAGRFELADGGTLFLDEIGELSAAAQAKLLRALDTMTFEPLGSLRSVCVNVRLVTATNRDLGDAVEAGAFRADLFYRLGVIDIHVPPLRERRGDIPLLLSDFLHEISERQGRPMPTLDASAVAALATYDYPGNVRELIHAVERAVSVARDSIIRVDDLPARIAAVEDREHATAPVDPELVEPLAQATRRFERDYVLRVLAKVDGHRGRAAALLGISRKSLWERLRGEPK